MELLLRGNQGADLGENCPRGWHRTLLARKIELNIEEWLRIELLLRGNQGKAWGSNAPGAGTEPC